MAVTYVRNPQTNEFELVGAGGATTDPTLSLAGKPADAAAVGSALSEYVQTNEFSASLNGKSDTNHTHTASDIGALPYIDARSADYDMDAILAGGTHYNTYRFNNTTLGTPYAKGLTTYSSGLIISTAVSTGSGKQVAYMNGEFCNYERTMKNGVIGDWCSTYNSGYKPSLSELGAAAAQHTHNVFSSITELGITTFPTTMSAVASAMPANSVIVIDTRRVNGTGTGYDTEIISDWNNTTNGMALIMKGVTTARVTMMILYGSSEASYGNFTMGNYASTTNTVNWTTMDNKLDTKVDKISKYSAVDLNTLTESGLYYVSDETTALHCPAGSNGHILVMSDGIRVRQVFFRVGTVDTNSFQWYSRHLGSDLTVGDNGWSQWWMLSGLDIAWSGTAKLNAEINLGSRYGCQGWVIAGQPTKTDTFSTIYIPRYFLTTDTDKYKLQIADETGYVSFYFYYKESDNNVYAKVVWVSDTTNSALRYAYRIS